MKKIVIVFLLISYSFGQSPKAKHRQRVSNDRCDLGDSAGNGYFTYKCDPVTKTWVLDKDFQAKVDQEEKHRKELIWALQSRVLTDVEMGEVATYGENLFDSMWPYNSLDRQKRLNEALLQQFRLRQVASHKGNCSIN